MIEKNEIWVERIRNLLEERGMKQKDLAQKCNVTTSTISDWIGYKKKGEARREPKISGFKDVAVALGVSTDYLLGADECKTPSNEEIHKITGLSDRAIEALVSANHSTGTDNGIAAKRLAVCNFLLERMNDTELFESLYRYLLGEFYFSKNKQDLGATVIYSKGPRSEETEVLAFAENYSHVYFSKVMQELSILKKTADEVKSEREKSDYENWLKTPEGIAFEQENLEQQPAWEEMEE